MDFDAMKILIVDDSRQMRQMTRTYLQDLAEEIGECADGSEALAAYRRLLPDWVLMDWEMKRMDGLAATREIRRVFPEANILMFTQFDDRELRAEAEAAGASGFITKDDLCALRSFLESNKQQ